MSMKASIVIRRCQPLFSHQATRRWSSTRTSDPLRILFCGSDDFSIASLRALHEEHKAQPDFIKSIDVVCRPPKRVGRGLKQLREVPIADVARSLHLSLHQIDTFTGWRPPKPDNEEINLIVAVSFGLFVPPRILGAAKYGGLNVHPSMLPDFRGSSPLHHTLLHGLSRTGISVQTLDSRKFDHGLLLAQTPQPGFAIPDSNKISVPELICLVAPKGAEMLSQVIKENLYVPPLEEVVPAKDFQEQAPYRMAPRLTTEDRHIDWQTWTADEILRKHRVIGPLWSYSKMDSSPRTRRVLWSGGFTKVEGHSVPPLTFQGVPGSGVPSDITEGILMSTCDNHFLLVDQVKLDGEKASPAPKALERTKSVSNGQSPTAFY